MPITSQNGGVSLCCCPNGCDCAAGSFIFNVTLPAPFDGQNGAKALGFGPADPNFVFACMYALAYVVDFFVYQFMLYPTGMGKWTLRIQVFVYPSTYPIPNYIWELDDVSAGENLCPPLATYTLPCTLGGLGPATVVLSAPS